MNSMSPLHEKAWSAKMLKDEILTDRMLSERNYDGKTVWHVAAKAGTLNMIPVNLFTEEVLSQTDNYRFTVWHEAAKYGTLKDIPNNLFNNEVLSQKDKLGNTVFHIAAEYEFLKDIPEHLITEEALEYLNNHGEKVLKRAAENNSLKDIPEYLISIKSLLEFTEEGVEGLIKQRKFKYGVLIKENKSFEKEIVCKDSRLEFVDIVNNKVHFSFEGINDTIIWRKDGVFLNNENYGTLNEAVLFIEKTYSNVEKSVSLPRKVNLELEEFML